MRIRFESTPFPLVRLDEAVAVLDHLRKPINSSERRKRPGPYPYYGANGQVGTIDDYLFDDELVLVAEDGGFFFDSLRPISYRVSGKCWVNNHAHVLKTRNSNDPDWICYALSYADVSELIKGATRAKLNQKELRQIRIPLPPLDEQRRIVSRIKECLSRVEEIQKLRRKTIEESRAILRALRHDIWRELTRDASPRRPLGQLVESFKNGLYKPQGYYGKGTAFVRMYNIVEGSFDSSRLERVDATPEERDKYSLEGGDILISRVNSRELVGKSGIYTSVGEPAVFEAMLIRVRVNRQLAVPEFVVEMMNSPESLSWLRSRARHAIGQSSLNQSDLSSLEIPVPDLPTQTEIVGEFRRLRPLASRLQTQTLIDLQEIERMPQAVLRKAFAGDV